MPDVRLQDILDIVILSILVYQMYSWFRRSQAIRLLIGLLVVMAIFFITRLAGLNMTSWVLQQLETVIFVLVVVVFQNEIRHALYRFSLLREFVSGTVEKECTGISAVSEAVFDLAAERVGAIIVFQRREQLDDHLLHGVPIDARLSVPLIKNIFCDATPLHDGAVFVRDERIVAASCLLPLSDSSLLPRHYGTRHRAALGLTEKSDAVVLVVSEERGEVSLATGGEITAISDSGRLKDTLRSLLVPADEQPARGLFRSLFSDMLPKLSIMAAVTFIWLMLALRQGDVSFVQATLKLKGVPAGMALVRVVPEEVTAKVRSTSALAPSPQNLSLVAEVDLAGLPEGSTGIKIAPSMIKAPAGISVISLDPSLVRVTLKTAKISK